MKKVINLAIAIENWVMLDNWTNYEKRLVFNGKLLIPNKLLVTDFYAKKLAIKHYPNVKIKQVPNYLLQSLKIVRKNNKKTNSIKKVIFYFLLKFTPWELIIMRKKLNGKMLKNLILLEKLNIF